MRCPICGNKVIKDENYPFCCQRCRDIDLFNWLSGEYSIPIREDDEKEN